MTDNENKNNENENEKLYTVTFGGREYKVTKESILYHFHMLKHNLDAIKRLED
jgi:hypothetical protein